MRQLSFDTVIGLIGLKAAGKDVLCEHLGPKGFVSRRMSDIIRAEMAAAGNANPTVQQMMDFSNARKKSSGDSGVWARILCEAASKAGERLLILNGIRNPGEIATLHKAVGSAMILVGVTAPFKLRAERAMKRGQKGDPLTLEGFMDMDDRDRGIGEPPEGQQVDRCLAQVPHERKYNNVGTLADFHAWIDGLLVSIGRAPAASAGGRFEGEFGAGFSVTAHGGPIPADMEGDPLYDIEAAYDPSKRQ